MKKQIFKDTAALLVITLVAVIVLAFVYEITKEPIASAVKEEIKQSFEKVFEGAVIDEASACDNTVTKSNTDIKDIRYAKDKDGNILGVVMSVTSHGGYGGDVVFSLGVDTNGVIKGLCVTAASSESPGLGAKCLEDGFGDRFEGKYYGLEFSKTGASGNEVDAISGATITTTAIVKAVNDALEFTENQFGYVYAKGGDNK